MAAKMDIPPMADSGKAPTRINTANPREAAFVAALNSAKGVQFASDSLEKWRKDCTPKSFDYHLAREIAYGTIRMSLALDYLAAQLTEKKRLNVKVGEKVLIRQAVYQAYFMDRIPLHAIVNETVALAKKHFHSTFANFLNAILRKLSNKAPKLPQGDKPSDISIRYSYPEFVVKQFLGFYGLEQTKEILECGNHPSQTLFRVRPGAKENYDKLPGVESFGILKDSSLLEKIASSPEFYIQNITPAELIRTLCSQIKVPKRILDLCASPGGKLIAAHDAFPKAELVANDVSKEKIHAIQENCEKYSIQAEIQCSKGEEFSDDRKFDIVILDVPCSNSGVLNKRAEARWRISRENIAELEKLQMELLKNASHLVSDNGQIWYMTCSILKQENELLIERVAKELSLTVVSQQTILPKKDGWDGGFACALKKV